MEKDKPSEIQLIIKDEGSRDPTKQNSTSEKTEKVIVVEGQANNNNNKKIDQRCVDYLRGLGPKCIDSNSKGSSHNDDNKETRAYKILINHIERDLVEKFPKKLWLIRMLVLGLIVCLLTTTRAIHVIHKQLLLHMKLCNGAILLLFIVSGLPFVRVATFILSEPFIWVFRMKRYTVLFGRLLKTRVDITIWLTSVLWVWYAWYRPQVVKDTLGAQAMHVSVGEYTHVLKIAVKEVTRLLLALNIGALLWTVKKFIFLKLLADLHFMALCDHIKHTFFDFVALRYIEMRNGRSYESQDQNQNSREDALWPYVSELNKERVPIWILKHLIDKYMEKKSNEIPMILKNLQDTDDNEKLMSEAKEMLQPIIDGVIDGDTSDINITSEKLRKYGMKDKEIERVFILWNKKENTDSITQDHFLRWAVKAVKRCNGLKRTIESSRHVLLMDLFVVVVSIVIWLLLSELVSTGQIAILFTPFVSASFIIGNSVSRAFDGLMFVFGLHPFDVGDRVIIDNEEMLVSELNILKTVFIKCDTGKTTIYANFDLCTKPIINLEVEAEDFDSVDFIVPLNTPQELLYDLQIKIKKTLDDEVAFSSDTVATETEISDSTVKVTVFFKHLVTYHSSELKALQRSKVLRDIKKLRKEMEMMEREMTKGKDPMPAHTLKFEFDVKLKLEKIEAIKKKIMRAVEKYPKIKEPFFQALFTGIDEEKINMDVRLWCLTDPIKTKEDKTNFINSIQNAIDKEEEKQPEDEDLNLMVFKKRVK